jgi:hypothetical protein
MAASHFIHPTIGIRTTVPSEMPPRFLLQAGSALCILDGQHVAVAAG